MGFRLWGRTESDATDATKQQQQQQQQRCVQALFPGAISVNLLSNYHMVPPL